MNDDNEMITMPIKDAFRILFNKGDWFQINRHLLKALDARDAVFLCFILNHTNIHDENLIDDWVKISRELCQHLIGYSRSKQHRCLMNLEEKGLLKTRVRNIEGEQIREVKVNLKSIVSLSMAFKKHRLTKEKASTQKRVDDGCRNESMVASQKLAKKKKDIKEETKTTNSTRARADDVVSSKSKTLKRLMRRMECMDWPILAHKQIEVVASRSLANFRRFLKSHSEWYSPYQVEWFDDDPCGNDSGSIKYKGPEHMRALLSAVHVTLSEIVDYTPLDFLTDWFKRARDIVSKWPDWSGDLSSFTFSVEHKEFQKRGYQLMRDYTFDAKELWTEYMKYVS